MLAENFAQNLKVLHNQNDQIKMTEKWLQILEFASNLLSRVFGVSDYEDNNSFQKSKIADVIFKI